jgi:hypothetical protein
MIQFPAIKSICPTLISKQGAGKGTLIQLLGKMMGGDKVFETAKPSRDVWGDFNGRMCNTFLVNLNELSKRETMDCEGRIKSLITDPKITINNKGVNQYDIQSFHRFIVTTNTAEPLNTSKDDRRNFIVRSSDEKCGDKEYFKELHDLLDDVDVIKSCYEYFKDLEGANTFNLLPIPTTEYQANLAEMAVSPIEQWLISFTGIHAHEETVTLSSSDACSEFKQWCAANFMEYTIDVTKFGVRLANLNIPGVKKGPPTKRGSTKVFNIAQLKGHFKLGCLLEDIPENISEDTDDESAQSE